MAVRDRLSDKNNSIPPTLVPIKVGAVVNWKLTAIAEHVIHCDFAWQNLQLRSANNDLIAQRAPLLRRYDESESALNEALAQLALIRGQWFAFLLPKGVR